ncbi:hypothetical protein [Silvimonas iriomotensis]|uniref:hypothetical protein n=1 Tax=Silvimonas iriomotensis TaxID=449662 RepID=UPI001665A4E7|nr:hypothetical protein [Silvimonas iriomotensis]
MRQHHQQRTRRGHADGVDQQSINTGKQRVTILRAEHEERVAGKIGGTDVVQRLAQVQHAVVPEAKPRMTAKPGRQQQYKDWLGIGLEKLLRVLRKTRLSTQNWGYINGHVHKRSA